MSWPDDVEPKKGVVADLYPHTPVLFQNVMEWANLKNESIVIDATVGFGGHAAGLLPLVLPKGQYLGIDKDEAAVVESESRLKQFGDVVKIVNGRFSQMQRLANQASIKTADLVLFDLGLSSPQLDDASYGISLKSTGDLDMRIGMGSGTMRASDILKYWSRRDLKALFTEHGQPATDRIVDRILRARESGGVKTVEQLRMLIENVAPRQSDIHPATRVFQALRVTVNDEYGELQAGLDQACELLSPGGRLIAISFHSGEDRIVKQFFQAGARGCICPPEAPQCICGKNPSLRVLTRRPIIPSRQEMIDNPRSRSAKMRVAEKIK